MVEIHVARAVCASNVAISCVRCCCSFPVIHHATKASACAFKSDSDVRVYWYHASEMALGGARPALSSHASKGYDCASPQPCVELIKDIAQRS